MNKSAIKNFAVSARRKLIEQVKQKAFEIGITEEKIVDLPEVDGHVIVNGVPQNGTFKEQRNKLKDKIKSKISDTVNYKEGYGQVMEEVAYMWFNRFIALRYMEVNDYLPTGVRVMSSIDPSRKEPDIIREALNVDLKLDKNKIYDFQDKNDTEGLYKYLVIKQCNALNEILPFMFEKIADYTELLFPSGLLMEGSVIRNMVETIDEEDWKEVEIVGWLYQYYISEKKDEVFEGLKQNKKISKENIPAATQLFTPKWIVQYMVENSLGRLWLESHPNEELKAGLKYYLEEAEQEPEVQKQLDELKNPNLNPLDIKILDPCCGSGHILVYAFDVLYEIYKSYGYLEEDIPKLIIENNLYGLDIDDRAAQLACFAVMMKARSKSSSIFTDKLKLNMLSIQESNAIPAGAIDYFLSGKEREKQKSVTKEEVEYLIEVFNDAKEYGSILDVKPIDFAALERRIEEIRNSLPEYTYEIDYKRIILENLPPIIEQAKIMSRQYDVVCTNPPYMGSKGMNANIKTFLNREYFSTKTDLFSVFMIRGFSYANKRGHIGFVTPYVWMFISSYEELRKYIIENKAISSLIQLEYNAFEVACVPVCSFTLRNYNSDLNGHYINLTNYIGIDIQPVKVIEAVEEPAVKYRFSTNTKVFSEIPGSPIAYWISNQITDLFKTNNSIKNFCTLKSGTSTSGKNDELFRFWFEIIIDKINFMTTSYKNICSKWVPMNKGGAYRRWYGNMHFVTDVVFCSKGENEFDKAITWSDINSHYFSARLHKEGSVANNVSKRLYVEEKYFLYILGYFNSIVVNKLLDLIIPTLHFDVGYIGKLPLTIIEEGYELNQINSFVDNSIEMSKTDWDSFETSWDFKQHPLLIYKETASTIQEAFKIWSIFTEQQFNQLKENEEELNRIFIGIYGLQDELTPEVEDKDITIRKANRERDIKSFISYAVGCMLGRYSLDEEGLVYAGGDFDINRYKAFKVDTDGVIPILDDEYFDDDIVTRFVEFVKVTFGDDCLSENLDYIAKTLGKKSSETSRDTIRRYFLKDFYKDHVQTYKNRPIYWMFTSGKNKAFNALIYMHRYKPTTVSTIRTDYIHDLQSKLEAEKKRLINVISDNDSNKEVNAARKKLQNLEKQMQELKKYEEVIHHLADQHIEIDLDDGVKVNYAKFKEVLETIKL